jgi:arylsulfatase A-like enzyme
MVVVVSDHGDMTGNYGRYGKQVIYDGAIRVPFILKYPDKIKKGLVIDQLIDHSVDIFPTILDVCGISIPEYAEGISLR